MAKTKKLPDPPRTEHVEGQESMFTDQQLWSYRYGKTAAQTPKPRKP